MLYHCIMYHCIILICFILFIIALIFVNNFFTFYDDFYLYNTTIYYVKMSGIDRMYISILLFIIIIVNAHIFTWF